MSLIEVAQVWICNSCPRKRRRAQPLFFMELESASTHLSSPEVSCHGLSAFSSYDRITVLCDQSRHFQSALTYVISGMEIGENNNINPTYLLLY